MPLVLAHLPHLALVLLAAGLVARVDAWGQRGRPTAAGLAAALGVLGAGMAIAVPAMAGGLPAEAAVIAYLAASALAAAHAGRAAPRRLPSSLRARLGGPARCVVGLGVGTMVAGACLLAAAVLAHGVVLPAV